MANEFFDNIPPPPSALHTPLRIKSWCCAIGLLACAAIALGLAAGEAQAQAPQDQCSDDSGLTTQSPIDITEPDDSTDNLEKDLYDAKIINTDDTRGVHLEHQGDGDIKITVKNSCIKTAGDAINSVPPPEEFIAAGVLGQSKSVDLTNENDVTIDVQDSTISTTGADAKGIAGNNEYEGDVYIDVLNSTIETLGNDADGIFGRTKNGQLEVNVTDVNITTDGILASGVSAVVFHGGDSDVTITVRGGEIITTSGDEGSDVDSTGIQRRSHGIDVDHQGTSGSLTIVARDGFRIETMGNYARGVYALRRFSENESDEFTIDLENGEITTLGDQGQGVYGLLDQGPGTGNLKIKLKNVDISTAGSSAHGVIGWHKGTNNTGNVDIDVRGGIITTKGLVAHGVYGLHYGNGKLTIDVQNAAITTESEDLDPQYFDTFSVGIRALHQGTGDVDIGVRGGSITTKGLYSYGIYASHSGTGVAIDAGDGLVITTTGTGSHGIYARHTGTGADRPIFIDVGGDVTASGMDAHGIRIGIVTSGEVSGVADLDDEGYRKQVVKVNSQVYGGSGESAGVWLAGGGRVFIGPQSSIGALSGIAILATGDSEGLKPKLLVDLMTGSRQIEDIFGENWIINDGGETTIVVNGTVLHDGATGVTRLWAPYGARDVTMREEGVMLADHSDAINGNTSPAITVADRDFSAADFIIGAYGPRAAVYEALPSAILQLDGRGGSARERLSSKESPLWIRLISGKGSYETERSTVGVDYNFDRFEVEAGIDFQLGESLTSSVGVRLVTGSADVSAPTRGGRITAQGEGLSFGLAWEGAKGFYGEGRAVATLYNTNLSSETRGELKKDVDINAHALSIEAGRRFALTERTLLTARAWVNQTGISIDRFTDRLGTRVTSTDKDRLRAGVGGIFETNLPWNSSKGKLSLRGALGVEQMFSDSDTNVSVSGENLKSKAPDDARLLLDLGMTYRQDRYTLRGAIQAHGLGSKANEYAARIELRTAF